MRKAGLFALLLAAACKPDAGPAPQSAPAPKDDRPVLLFLGDSLTAGYGVSMEEAFPALIAGRHPGVEVRNAGVSGSTTAGVLENLGWNLTDDVDYVFLAIGANDGLRGLKLADTRANIEGIVAACRERDIPVALGGMRIPPNYGAEYAEEFAGMFPALAAKLKTPLLPFLLEGVGGRPEFNIEDGIHPNAAGHEKIARAVEAFLKKEGWLR